MLMVGKACMRSRDAGVHVGLRRSQRALYLAADGAPRRIARRLAVTTLGVQAVLRALCCMGADDVAPVFEIGVRGKVPQATLAE